MKIISNHHRRELLNWHEVDDPTAQADFEYVGDDTLTPRFVRYKGEWCDVYEFLSAPERSLGPDGYDWDAYWPDTYFSGVLVKFLDGDDEGFVQMGRYYT